jgi:hypothetical protein
VQCAGYTGPWLFYGIFTKTYPQGFSNCVVELLCYNLQSLAGRIYGQKVIGSRGSVDCYGVTCNRYEVCFYDTPELPEIYGYDPNSEVLVGTGIITYQYEAGCVTNGRCWNNSKLKKTFCDGNFIGYAEENCPPFAPNDTIKELNLFDSSGFQLLNTLENPIAIKQEVEPFSVKVSPNPFDNQIKIQITSAIDQLVYITVINALGVVIHEENELIYSGITEMDIELATNNISGVYVVQIKDSEKRSFTEKITKY